MNHLIIEQMAKPLTRNINNKSIENEEIQQNVMTKKKMNKKSDLINMGVKLIDIKPITV